LIAARRAHLLLLVGTCLTQVLMAAAQSRSGWFAPCAAFFTLAVLTLFVFDLGATLRGTAATIPIGARGRGRGGMPVTLLVLAVALPLYLYVPQPPALYLGGRSATSAHDYSDPRGPPGADPAQHGSDRAHEPRAGVDRAPSTDDAGDAGAPDDAGNGNGDGTSRTSRSGTSKDELSVSGVQRDAATANVIVMYVKTSHPLYLRGHLLDRFVGDRWQRTGAAPLRTTLRDGYLRVDAPDTGVHVAQQIDVVADLSERALFAGAGVTQIRFPGPQLYDNGDGTFAAPRALRKDTGYSVDAAPRLIGGRYAIDAPPPDARYLQIDPALSPRVRELAQSVTANAADAWHKALAVENHLRGNYQYSYATIVPYQGRTPLEWFLFENRKGHCEFFASAMVLMLREIGIPARLANGFSLGERNPLTGYYEVRAMEGHAWAEAWIAGRGWVMFEPTPFYPMPHDEDTPQPQVAGATDRYLQRMADTSAQLAPQSLRTAWLEIARDAWTRARHLQRVLAEMLARALPWLPLVAAAGLLAWSVLLLAWLAWRDARERVAITRLLAAARTDAGHALQHLAAAIELTFASRGAPRPVQRTWREYCGELNAADADAVLAEFVDAFERARYGNTVAPLSGTSIAALERLVRARVAAQRYPRLAEQQRQWSHWLRAWVGGAHDPHAGAAC